MSDLGLVEHKVGYLPARRVEAHLVEEAHLRGTTRGTMRRIVYYYTNYIKSLYFAITLTILHHYIIMPSIS